MLEGYGGVDLKSKKRVGMEVFWGLGLGCVGELGV